MDPRVAAPSCGTTTHSLTRTQTGKGGVGGVGAGLASLPSKKTVETPQRKDFGSYAAKKKNFPAKCCVFFFFLTWW